MAFYTSFWRSFPLFWSVSTIVTHLPHHSDHLKSSLRDLSAQLFPTRVSQLFQGMFTNFSARPSFRPFDFFRYAPQRVWAAHNGTWAMIYGPQPRPTRSREHPLLVGV